MNDTADIPLIIVIEREAAARAADECRRFPEVNLADSYARHLLDAQREAMSDGLIVAADLGL